jgi:hypothetical protein
LADTQQVRTFSVAIAEVIKPGQVVLDLASGTGILDLLACRAGAKRAFYSIELGGMISVARDVARANGFEDRVIFVKGFSTHVDLPEKADVVVADQIGNFGFNAGIIGYFADARRRCMKTEGLTIPLAMSLMHDAWSGRLVHRGPRTRNLDDKLTAGSGADSKAAGFLSDRPRSPGRRGRLGKDPDDGSGQ